MTCSNPRSIHAFKRVARLVSGKLAYGRRIISESFLLNRLLSRGSPTFSLQEATHVVIVCLCYPGMNTPDGETLTLNGTKNDFPLLLRHLGYRHEGDSRRFTLIHDFDVDIKDAWDVEKVMPGKSRTKAAIKEAIQNTLSTTTTNSKVLFYFAGHGILRGPEVHGGEPSQSLIVGDNELINGEELRSWLCDVPDQSVSVTAVIDACHSGGSLALPYTYELRGKNVHVRRTSRIEVPIHMLQIAAARSGQLAYSGAYGDTCYGRLTSNLVQFFESTKNPTIEGLVKHLYPRCGPPGEQLPQVCSSPK